MKLLEIFGMVDCKSMSTPMELNFKKLSGSVAGHVLDATVIICDNQRGIRLSENLVFHERSKHVDGWYHFIWDMV